MESQDIGWLLITSLVAFGTVYRGIPILIQITELKHLFDDPREGRKIHQKATPNLGGIVLITAFLVSFTLHPAAADLSEFHYLIASTIILFAIGVKDDLLNITPWKKIAGQLFVATVLIFGSGLTISSFGGIFGVGELPAFVSIPITYLTFVVMINAVNLIDGIDGLAASFTAMASGIFAVWFYTSGQLPLFVFSLLLAVTYGSFLLYNWKPARIFMGDTGSLLSGFYLAFLGIHFLNSGLTYPALVSWQPATAVVLVAILVLPLYDTLRVFFLRTIAGKSPFKPDANHIHHQYLKEGYDHAQATISLILANLFLVTLTLFGGQHLVPSLLFFLLVPATLLLFPTLSYKRRALHYLRTSIYRSDLSFKRNETIQFNPEEDNQKQIPTAPSLSDDFAKKGKKKS